MHLCPDCGKSMATAGGLEIHQEMFHAPPPPQVPLNPEALDADAEPDGAPERVPVLPAVPVASAAKPSGTTSVLRGYDPTIPLTALLVLTMLVAAIGAAVHRSANPAHAALASVSTGVTPTTLAPVAQAPASSAPSPAGSPAAIPPAGSQPPAAAQTSACKQVVDSLSTRNSHRNVELGELIRTNTFPPLPLPGFEHPQIADLMHAGTAREYVDGFSPGDPTKDVYQQLLVENGFVGADLIDYVNGDSSYGVGVFRFTTASGARAYNRAIALNACTRGILANPQVMPGLSGGMTYLITDGGPPFRATFVAGDTVVHLQVCHCVQAPDDQALAGQWARTVAANVGA